MCGWSLCAQEEIKEYQEKNARKPASPVNPSSSHKPNFPDYGKHSQSSSGLTDSGYGRSGHQDADDATIGALKDELHRLQMQSLDLERCRASLWAGVWAGARGLESSGGLQRQFHPGRRHRRSSNVPLCCMRRFVLSAGHSILR